LVGIEGAEVLEMGFYVEGFLGFGHLRRRIRSGEMGFFAAVFALLGSYSRVSAIAQLLELGVDAVWLVELDPDLGAAPVAVGAG
jgi:hypothetical protein